MKHPIFVIPYSLLYPNKAPMLSNSLGIKSKVRLWWLASTYTPKLCPRLLLVFRVRNLRHFLAKTPDMLMMYYWSEQVRTLDFSFGLAYEYFFDYPFQYRACRSFISPFSSMTTCTSLILLLNASSFHLTAAAELTPCSSFTGYTGYMIDLDPECAYYGSVLKYFALLPLPRLLPPQSLLCLLALSKLTDFLRFLWESSSSLFFLKLPIRCLSVLISLSFSCIWNLQFSRRSLRWVTSPLRVLIFWQLFSNFQRTEFGSSPALSSTFYLLSGASSVRVDYLLLREARRYQLRYFFSLRFSSLSCSFSFDILAYSSVPMSISPFSCSFINFFKDLIQFLRSMFSLRHSVSLVSNSSYLESSWMLLSLLRQKLTSFLQISHFLQAF